jgi:hypothetical protein
MTLLKRLGEVEDNLTPREAMTRWMREAHAFGSYGSYARWLIDQPDDVYPLMRMPGQVKGAIKAQNKGVPELKLHREFRRAEKDLLFLYYLHSQATTQAIMDHEAVQLRVVILVKEIRALIKEKHALDQMRLSRVDPEGSRHARPDTVELKTKTLYEDHLRTWPPEADEIRNRILAFLAAAEMISRQFFAGEDILFPDTRENLEWNLSTVRTLCETYADSLLGRAYESDDQFRDYLLRLEKNQEEVPSGGHAPAEATRDTPDVRAQARVLAEQWILMARAEALDELGEYREAEALAARVVRENLG